MQEQGIYKTLIIEDEQQLSEMLLLLLDHAAPGKIAMAGIAGTINEAVQLIDTVQPHLVFMDIQLKDGTAFDVLDQISFQNFYLIFTTAYQQHAIRAFKYCAIDYLLKPVNLADLKNAIERIEQLGARYISIMQLQHLHNHLNGHSDRILLPTQEGVHIVPLVDIVRCETSGSYTTFHIVSGEKIIVSKPLKSYDELLMPPKFFRIHQSHTVNLSFVKTYSKEGALILKDNTGLQVAQRKKEEFLRLIKG